MIEIAGRKISRDHPPYVIAELSANHNGNIEHAKIAIERAKASGASAVKLQSYTPETMTIQSSKPDFVIEDGLWRGYTLYELYAKAQTPYEWHSELFKFAEEIGITIFSTPFDESAVTLLDGLGAPAFKIASFELVDLPLIKRAAECGKPLLMSTGMSNLDEIREALGVALKFGCGEVLLFHCISSYPTPIEDSNLLTLEILSREFGVCVGLSDHTKSNIAAVVSIGLGAVAIEKHFKLSEDSEGVDASFSLDPNQFRNLVDDCNHAWKSIGSTEFSRPPSEEGMKKFKRSLYFMNNLKKGARITPADIRSIRPGYGLAPKYFDSIVGRVLSCDVEIGDPVTFNVLEPTT